MNTRITQPGGLFDYVGDYLLAAEAPLHEEEEDEQFISFGLKGRKAVRKNSG